MTELFRNTSPGALTRQQAVALMKKRMKEPARQARELAAAGRGDDTEIAHVALGELVVPEALQSPEVLDVLRRAAASQNIPFDRLRVPDTHELRLLDLLIDKDVALRLLGGVGPIVRTHETRKRRRVEIKAILLGFRFQRLGRG